MPWRGPEYPGEFPTLGYVVADWIQAHCVVPDREQRGEPYVLTEEQLRFLLLFYRLTEAGQFFYLRGGQLIRPQKWGKGPLAATMICAEAVGPVLFAGWDAKGDPVGRPWPTPWVQVTACSEAQTRNVWRALQPMIELGVLGSAFMADTGLTRINLPSGGLIEPVTASASSRLGNPITFVVQDQTESWVRTNHGWELADNQRRNLGGTGGRFMEICNAPDPVQQSVALRTGDEPHVYIDDVDGGPGSIRVPEERHRVMRVVYGDSLTERGGWVDLERVDAEIEALLKHDPAQAERFYLNRKLATEGAAFDVVRFRELAVPRAVAPGSVIVIGIDGARFDDALAVIATDVRMRYQWPLGIWERPEDAPDDYEHPMDEVDAVVLEAFSTFVVWRAYCDPQRIEDLMRSWQGRFSDKRVVPWYTNRQRPMAWAVRKYAEAIGAGDLSQPGAESELGALFDEHIANARKREVSVLDDDERPMHIIAKDAIRSPRKIDAASAAVISWEASGDAIASGLAGYAPPTPLDPEQTPDQHYRPGYAPPSPAAPRTLVGPMGSMS